MNEVLPDPTLNRAPNRTGGPRDRTMNHMQALLATAAAASVVGCGAKEEPKPDPAGSTTTPVASSAATPGDAPSVTQKDPTPPASASAAPSAVASASASAAPSSSAVVSTPPTTKPTTTVPPVKTPYIVVDPMPPPYRNGKSGPNQP